MSFSNTNNVVFNLGNDTTGEYNFSYQIQKPSDLIVKVRNVVDGAITTLTEGTDFSVTVDGIQGGKINLINVGQDWLDGSGYLISDFEIMIKRSPFINQTSEFRNSGPYFAELHEDRFDRQTYFDQDLKEQLDRAAQFDEFIKYTDPSVKAVLPRPEANKYLKWHTDEDGTLINDEQAVDLSDYYTKSEVDQLPALANKIDKGDVTGNDLVLGNHADPAVLLDLKISRLYGQLTPASTVTGLPAQGKSVTYGNGLFVAVAIAGTNRVMTSPDGITWTARTAAAANSWQSVTYGNGLFVAVSTSGVDRVMTSPDGITWTSRTPSADGNWQSVTYGNGLFVAVGNTFGVDRVMTSPDGITWTARTEAAASSWQSVTYGNGLFVAVGNGGVNTERGMTSPDGITWTLRVCPGVFSSVTYGNGLFVAVGIGGGSYRVSTSPDGITWTPRTPVASNQWQSVTYGNGLFVAVSSDGSRRMMQSTDGITWTDSTVVSGTTWQSVVWSGSNFVAVSLHSVAMVVPLNYTDTIIAVPS